MKCLCDDFEATVRCSFCDNKFCKSCMAAAKEDFGGGENCFKSGDDVCYSCAESVHLVVLLMSEMLDELRARKRRNTHLSDAELKDIINLDAKLKKIVDIIKKG